MNSVILWTPVVVLGIMFFAIQAGKISKNFRALYRPEDEAKMKTIIDSAAKPTKTEDQLLTPTKNDQRHAPREDYYGLVDFVISGKLFKETAKNLSKTGVFLRSRNVAGYNVGDMLTLALQTAELKPLKRSARIVRLAGDGIGVQFI